MQNIDDVGMTAFMIAYFRAQEGLNPNPLFEDKYAKHFLTDAISKRAKLHGDILPASQLMVRYRTKYINDALRRAITSGSKQVLILGAGFDTRSLLPFAKQAQFFEIDRKPVLDYKRAVLSSIGVNYSARLVPCDYIKEDFISKLTSNGFDCSQPTFIIWEGNTAYLTKDETAKSIKSISDRVDHFVIAIDYLSDMVVTRATGVKSIDDTLDLFERMGSPWITGYKNVHEIAELTDLEAAEDCSAAELAKEYLGLVHENAEILNHYYLCTLRVFL